MSHHHSDQACAWNCPRKGTANCVKCLLTAQAVAGGRVTLGVLCGLKSLYHPQPLPPCIRQGTVDWSGPKTAETAAMAA